MLKPSLPCLATKDQQILAINGVVVHGEPSYAVLPASEIEESASVGPLVHLCGQQIRLISHKRFQAPWPACAGFPMFLKGYWKRGLDASGLPCVQLQDAHMKPFTLTCSKSCGPCVCWYLCAGCKGALFTDVPNGSGGEAVERYNRLGHSAVAAKSGAMQKPCRRCPHHVPDCFKEDGLHCN